MRPDIDALYNQGGWPSTVIMTPQGEVLTGGAYIPPDDLLGRMKQIIDIFQHDRGTITGWLEETRVALAKRELSEGAAVGAPAPGEKDLGAIVKPLRTFDEQRWFRHGRNSQSPSRSISFLPDFTEDPGQTDRDLDPHGRRRSL
jgi:uncharacterized protein YyaL (SSP411 family)